MKFLVVLIGLCAAVSAVPTFLGGGPAFITETIPLRTQFVAQDAIGHYSYGYSGESAARSETKSLDGVTRGAYSYVDADGKLQSVEYTADALNGFRASATNLPTSPVDNGAAPEPVQETEEVAKARAEHLAAFKEAEIRAAAAPEEPEEEQAEAEAAAPASANGEDAAAADAAEDMMSQGATGGQVPASTSAAAPGTIALSAPITPVATRIHAVHAAVPVGIHAYETSPVSSSYSYQVESNSNPSYSYSVATPAYTAPVKTINTIAYAPVIGRPHFDIIGERHIDFNGHLATF